MRKLGLFILLLTAACFLLGQSISFPGPGLGHTASLPAITLGVHAAHDNGASTATTVVVGPITPTAGSTIYCDVKYPVVTFTSVADNVNSGNYQYAVVPLRDSGHNFEYGSFYKENVAASATTITLTYISTGTHAQMACKEIIGVPATYSLDSSVMQSRASSGTNPANPNSYTPFADGAMVLSGLLVDSTTPTAGANFTLLDSASLLFPEYWIQTTKTATTGPFVDASSPGYAIGMAAFGQNVGGNCDATMVMDWTGGANAGTPTTTTLQNSTKGGQAQPNAENVNQKPGWALGGAAAGLTYATAAYVPLVTLRTCPFYSGTGTGTLGLAKDGSAAGGIAYNFANVQSKATMAACISTNTPVAHGGTIDTLTIDGGDQNVGNPDFITLQMNSNGATSTFGLEASGRTTVTSSTAWVQNTAYWIRIEFNQAGNHKAYIYTFSGASCTGTPTLQETMTSGGSPVSGGGPADKFAWFGSNDSYAAGTSFFVGTTIVDMQYGSALMP